MKSPEHPPKASTRPALPSLPSGPVRSVEVEPGVRHLDKLEPGAMAQFRWPPRRFRGIDHDQMDFLLAMKSGSVLDFFN